MNCKQIGRCLQTGMVKRCTNYQKYPAKEEQAMPGMDIGRSGLSLQNIQNGYKRIINKLTRMKGKFLYPLIFALSALMALMAFKKVNRQIVCFGDSITYGAQVDGHSWVYFLSEDHPGIDFINAGRSGRKTADRNELLPVLKKYPNADDYLIFLGVNDL